MKFRSVEAKPNFSKKEKKLLSWWYQSGVVKKYLTKNKKAKKRFFFLDGPITANNPMGVHHAWGRTLKDLYRRYHNMRGEEERFQNGFDCQGLWVEVEVEKELGFKSKKEIENYGIAKFVEKCKARVRKYSEIQTKQSKRLGYFMDWDSSYYTMSEENNFMIWHLLKKCHQKGWLYKGFDVVPWCPRCGTAISQHEILQEEYQELSHQAVFFKLALRQPNKLGLPSKTSLLVWTTTPWTIPGNVALAVNPELTYMAGEDKDTGEVLIILAKEEVLKRAGIKNFKCLKRFKGSKLVGLFYQSPFADLPLYQKRDFENAKNLYKIVADKDMVSGEEGTALVHISTGTGKEDFHLGKKEKLPIVLVINSEGYYLKGFGQLAGKNATQEPALIFKLLKEKGALKKIEDYRHRYPTCWRCKEELLFRAVEEWYIAMDPLREPIKKVAKKASWIPQWGLDREIDWLKNMDDWLISKKRYWGLALPIWECKCGFFEVIGSKEEIKKRAVSGWEEFKGHSPHRPWIDKVKIKCSQCGQVVSRIADVGNPWLDAGIVPFSTLIDPQTKVLSYMEDKKYWQKWFPADLVLESFPGQFKNWFYSLLAMSTILENKTPFKTLVGHALVRDEKGEEMHKSKGNAIWFDEAVEKMGVDVMRWMYSLQPHTLNLNFGYNVADETRRRFILILWNVYKFFVIYANLNAWQPKKKSFGNLTLLDQWILTRLDLLITKVTSALDKYDNPKAAKAIENFVIDLSGWYLRRSRDRVGPRAVDRRDRDVCHSVLYQVLITLSQLLAPFIPFISEEIYKNLTGQESVHLTNWPRVKEKKVNLGLLKQMELVRQICELGHGARKKAEIKVRQPLQLIKVILVKEKLAKELVQLIKEELNVKEVYFELGKEMKVKLDTKITPELKKEGQARDLVRLIQEARKKAGCKPDQLVTVYLPSWPEEHQSEIKRRALIKNLKKGKTIKIVKG